MKKSLLSLTLAAALFASNVQAQHTLSQPQEFRAPIRASAVITKPAVNNHAHLAGAGAQTQKPLQKSDVFLMNVPLTAEQKKKLRTFQPEINNFKISTDETSNSIISLPRQIDLGMNEVPVLNQGMHGTCVTFANTAALDALIGKGNYISQLCSLEVGKYLETRSYLPSGWDGSFGSLVLDRIREFGIVSLANQTAQTCAGVADYPVDDLNNTGNPMLLEEYSKLSEDFNDTFYWYSLVTPFERFSWTSNESADKLLTRVKEELAETNAKTNTRLTLGALLPVGYCSAGACGKYHKTDDTWAITKAIKNDPLLEFGGHEMVITGYDDNAVAIDNEGSKHKGLLILRNSWGDSHGDGGNYYMTYSFFKHYVMEVQKIGKYE